MNYYFIDYENVHSDGFVGIEENLGKDDRICLMYTDACKQIPFEVLEKIIHKQDLKLEVIKAGTGGKNALDFQLSSYMGYVIAKNEGKNCVYYIVSKDMGFDHLIDFWKEKGANVKRICNFSSKNGTEKTTKSKKTAKTAVQESKSINTVTKKELLNYITKDEYSDTILQIINKYKTKSSISNNLAKEFHDSKKSSAIYKKIKTLLNDKNKT